MKSNFLILFFIILLFRVALFILPSFQIDMGDWEAWSYRLITGGFSNFYSQNYFSDYFPGYLYILWIIGNIYHFIFSNLSFANFKFEVLIKTVTTLFDVGTAYYIYKITNKYSPKYSKIAAFLYLVNPALIFNSSIWGQIDGVFTFFLVSSSYLLIEKRKHIISDFFYAISILIKPQALALLPISLMYNLKNYKNKFIKYLIIISIIPILSSAPFFLNDSIFGLLKLAQKSVEVYPYNSLFAFNLWGIFGWWQPDSKILIFSYKTWGIILYAISLVLILSPLIKEKFDSSKFFLATSLSFFSFYLFLTRMHERYLFPFFAFILIAAIIKKSKLLLLMYFLLSLIYLSNLWYVYYYYSFVFNNLIKENNLIFRFVDMNHGIFSITAVLCFLLILKFYYAGKRFF